MRPDPKSSRNAISTEPTDCEGDKLANHLWIMCGNHSFNLQETTIHDYRVDGNNSSKGSIPPTGQLLKPDALMRVSRKDALPRFFVFQAWRKLKSEFGSGLWDISFIDTELVHNA